MIRKCLIGVNNKKKYWGLFSKNLWVLCVGKIFCFVKLGKFGVRCVFKNRKIFVVIKEWGDGLKSNLGISKL